MNKYLIKSTGADVIRTPVRPKIVGGGGPNLVEPQALTVSIGRSVVWRKVKVDLTELAKLRWVDKWTIERLAGHFGLGTNSIKMNLRQLRK